MDNNTILYMPFDDPDDYGKAYDYSKSRIDGTLSGGATFTKNAHKSKALSLNGTGICDVAKDIPFSSDFTLTCWIKPATDKLTWLLNFSGINKYVDQTLDVKVDDWMFIAFVKRSTLFTVYINGISVYSQVLSGSPVGFSINDAQADGGSYSCIDELRIDNVARTQSEIMQIQADKSDVEYYVDGKNFKDFGVYVSKSSGLVGGLAKKEALSVDYDTYHGVVVDKARPRYKERTITLECFIEASGKAAFVEWANMFISQFDKAGDRRLKVEYAGETRPLVFQVDRNDATDIEKVWNDELMVGTFQLKLRECEPVKRVLRFIGSGTASIKVTTAKMINIYWGDDTYDYNVSGTDKTITHTYNTDGVYDIIITGNIEDITDFSTNCIVVWNKMM
jgi:hypothetical protein